MSIVAIANQKGGVGKTTTAVTLGHGLAMWGYTVLLIDLDPQGHIAESLGMEKAPGLHDLLVERHELGSVVVPVRDHLYAVLGNKTTERVKRYLASEPFSHKALKKALNGAPYDVILLDCAPSFDILHIAALVASDYLLVPTKLEHLAADGLNELLISAAQLREEGESTVQLTCILPTFFERVTRETTEQLRLLVEQFGAYVWPPIPSDTRVREASAYGKTIWEYARQSNSLQGYPRGDDSVPIGGYINAMVRLIDQLELEESEDV